MQLHSELPLASFPRNKQFRLSDRFVLEYDFGRNLIKLTTIFPPVEYQHVPHASYRWALNLPAAAVFLCDGCCHVETAWALSLVGLIKWLLLGSPKCCLVTNCCDPLRSHFGVSIHFFAGMEVSLDNSMGTNVRILRLLFLPLMGAVAFIAIPVQAYLVYFFTQSFFITFVFDNN